MIGLTLKNLLSAIIHLTVNYGVLKMTTKGKIELTGLALGVVFGAMIIFTLAIKVIDHREELKGCQDKLVGYSELEKKAECRR